MYLASIIIAPYVIIPCSTLIEPISILITPTKETIKSYKQLYILIFFSNLLADFSYCEINIFNSFNLSSSISNAFIVEYP